MKIEGYAEMPASTVCRVRSGLVIMLFAGTVAGCATVGGAAIGTGIGALAGDPKTGMAVGATAGAVVDVFGR